MKARAVEQSCSPTLENPLNIRESDAAELRTHLWLALLATSELHIQLIRALDGYDVWEKTPTPQSYARMMRAMQQLDMRNTALINLPAWQDNEELAADIAD